MAVRIACIGVLVFALAYMATAMFPIPLPVFDPRADVWIWAGRPEPAQMRYFGQLAAALLAALAVTAPLARMWRDRPQGATTAVDRLFAAWAAVASALCLAYYAWHNWP